MTITLLNWQLHVVFSLLICAIVISIKYDRHKFFLTFLISLVSTNLVCRCSEVKVYKNVDYKRIIV